VSKKSVADLVPLKKGGKRNAAVGGEKMTRPFLVKKKKSIFFICEAM
jgi:hypothetical protein